MNPNQFILRPVTGLINRIYSPFTVSGRHDNSAAKALPAGAAVKLTQGSTGTIWVGAAESTDVPYGVAGLFNPIYNQWPAGKAVEIALKGTHVYYEVSAAITAGSRVKIAIDATTNAVTAAPALATDNAVGIAVTAQATVGQFVEVVIDPTKGS